MSNPQFQQNLSASGKGYICVTLTKTAYDFPDQCENFLDISNSSIQFITDGHSSVVMVTCNTGTTLIGQSEVECQTDGTWNVTSTPTCGRCNLSNIYFVYFDFGVIM